MTHYYETVSKFLSALMVDSIHDVKYDGKRFGRQYCVCGQAIELGYFF